MSEEPGHKRSNGRQFDLHIVLIQGTSRVGVAYESTFSNELIS